MNIADSWLQEANRLEREVQYKRELAKKHKYGEENIK